LTDISLAGGARKGGFAVRSRADRERTYRRALRHSRHVRWLRIALIGAIAVLLLAVVADNYLPVEGLRLPGEVGKLVIKGTTITMQQPRINGYTADARPYQFTASAAHQDITKPDIVELQQIQAKMQMADKSTVRLSADTGIYNMKTDMLTLNDNIHLISSTGYEARLLQAVINMSKSEVVSERPVWVKLLDGDLNAKRLEITDDGDIARFSDVTMLMQPGKPKAAAGRP
jgi:lipopolysaccharide export system protein LptC